MRTIMKHPFLIGFPLVLVLPFPLIIDSVALVLACVNLLVLSFFDDTAPDWRSVYSEPLVWIGLFVLAVDPLTSLLRGESAFDIRTSRLAFLLIPVVFYLFRDLLAGLRQAIMSSFVLGVVLYIFYSYIYLLYFYTSITNRSFSFNHYLQYDLTEYLPGAYHHSYLGMYMTFAIILLTFGRLIEKKWQALLLSVFILINQFFMGGKITLLLSIILIAFYIWKSSTKKKWVLGAFTITAGLGLIAFYILGLFESLGFSISNRVLSWRCSLEAINQHPLFGLGKDKVFAFLSECVDNDAISTHNQILNELMNYGLFGSWIFFFFWILIKRSRNDLVFALWVVLIIILCQFENVLSLQRGILFVCFFSVTFILSRPKGQKWRPDNNI